MLPSSSIQLNRLKIASPVTINLSVNLRTLYFLADRTDTLILDGNADPYVYKSRVFLFSFIGKILVKKEKKNC